MIYGSLVIKNEEDRYLAACLRHMRPLLDGLFVYDDRSTDNSVAIAEEFDCQVTVRSERDPSFMQHEGEFRYDAWLAFERTFLPEDGDWVLSFDADEFMVQIDGADPRVSMVQSVAAAERMGAVGVVLPFPEIFGFDHLDGRPLARKDGYWGGIQGPRFFKYRSGGTFNDKPMGCGSEPTYVAKGPLSYHSHGLHVLHFGYAKKEDVAAKYERYSNLFAHGHSDSHIQSIPRPPRLEKWMGPVPVLVDTRAAEAEEEREFQELLKSRNKSS